MYLSIGFKNDCEIQENKKFFLLIASYLVNLQRNCPIQFPIARQKGRGSV